MAQVPYSGVPSVSGSGPGNLRENIQSSPADFGGLIGGAEQTLGRDIGSAGKDIFSSALGLQEMYNKASVQDATNKALDIGTDVLYDPDKGYLTTQGRAAMDGYHSTVENIKSRFQGIRDGLTSDMQRTMFDESARRYMYYYQREAGAHADQQSKQWYDQTDKATRLNSIQTSATSWNNPDMALDNLERGRTSIMQDATRNGWDPQNTQLQMRHYESAFALTQLKSQAVTDPAGALDRYNNGFLPGQLEPDPDHPGKLIRKQIPIKDLIDAESKEGFVKPLMNQAKNAAMDAWLNGQMGGGGGAAGARTLPAPIQQRIIERATTRGVDPSVPLTINRLEQPNGVDAPGNTHQGLFQLGPNEWKQFGGTDANRGDLGAQADIGTDFVAASQRAASQALGRPAQGWETYVTHQQGSKGGPALLTADPDAKAVDVIAPLYSDRAVATRAIVNNGGTADMTAGQFLTLWRDKYARASGGVPPAAAVVQPVSATGGVSGDVMSPPGAEAQKSPAEAAFPDEEAVVQKAVQAFPDPEDQQKVVARVRNRFNLLKAATQTERDDLVHSLSDMTSSALDGHDINYSEQNIRHLLPPAQAARVLEQLSIAKSAGQSFKAIQWGTPEQIDTEYQRLSAGLGPDTRGLKVTGGTVQGLGETGAVPPEPTEDQSTSEQYRMREHVRDMFTRKVAQRNQLLATDAQTYAGQNPLVQAKGAIVNAAAQAAKGVNDPNDPRVTALKQATDDFFRQSLDVQTQLGVPSTLQHIMTKAHAQTVAQSLMTADPSTTDAGAAFNKMAADYGSNWNRAFGDIKTLGKLPPSFQVLAMIPDPVVRNNFQSMMKMADEKGGMQKLHELAGQDNMRQINQDIDTNGTLQSFVRSANIPGIYNNLDNVLGIKDAVKNLAAYYSVRGETSGGEAVKKAATDIIDSKYDFDGNLRVPKGKMAPIENYGDSIVEQLSGKDLAPLQGRSRLAAQLTGPVAEGGPNNMPVADAALKLTPQEKYLYQYHLNHLTGQDGGAIKQPDGSTSTLLQTSQEHDGRFYNVPTVWGGKEHTEDEAADHAAEIGWDRWPSYATRGVAEARYGLMHGYMERDITGADADLTSRIQRDVVRPIQQDASEDALREVKRSGKWVTNENDAGAFLVAQDKNGVPYQVRRADGSRVEFTFKDATSPGLSRPSVNVPQFPL